MRITKHDLVKVFDSNADDYEKYRPRYPKAIIDQLNERLGKSANCLEIGCGTGQLTADILKSGHSVLGIERGAALCRKLQEKWGELRTFEVINEDFESWKTNATFKAVLSAQAFHWIDMESGIDKVLSLLEENGHLLLIWHVDRSHGTEFWRKTSPIYERFFPTSKHSKRTEDVATQHLHYLRRLEAFNKVEKTVIAWEKVYTKATYLGLLRTFSGHMTLQKEDRQQFFAEIGAVIDEHGGELTRFHETVLVAAQKK